MGKEYYQRLKAKERQRQERAELRYNWQYRNSVPAKRRQRERNRENVKTLKYCYVKARLRQSGLTAVQITPEMLSIKREQLLLFREIRNLKREVQRQRVRLRPEQFTAVIMARGLKEELGSFRKHFKKGR